MDITTPTGSVDSNGVLWKATRPGSFLTSPEEGVETCWDVIVTAAKKYPTKLCAGARPVLATEVDDKGFEKLTLGPYEWIDYTTYFTRVSNLGAGLVKLAGLSKGETMVLYADTQLAWMMFAFAGWRQGIIVGTIYATLGEDGAQYGITQSKATCVVADRKLVKILANIADACKSTLKLVISIGEVDAKAAEKLSAAGIKIVSMEEVEAAGKAAPCEPTPAGPLDVSVLMYTSGTTGNPKGVLITHQNVVAMVAAGVSETGVLAMKPWNLTSNADGVFLAYLPLAHIMELAVECGMYYAGVKVGYGTTGTVLATSPKMKQTTPPQEGDAVALKPTVFLAAPAVLDKIFAAVKAKIAAAPGPIKALFGLALASGAARYDRGLIGAHPCVGFIFKPVQKLLGGRVKAIVTGSAPLGVEVQKFVQSVFACPVRQGYGLTETTAASCVTLLSDNSPSVVGPPQECCCIRLRDWEEGGYTIADKDNPEIGKPRGEVLIGGPMVCAGYLVDKSNPDKEVVKKNEEDFVTLDGIRYFCTGDVGQFTPTGNLQIVDRKKDLVKLQMGEYVALSKVENAIKGSKYVALPMVYAESSHSYCIALVCPLEPALKKLADGKSIQELCADSAVIAEVLKDVQAACKAAKCAKFEIPTKVILIEELWTPDNGMLTAVNKLKRKEIKTKHLAEISAIYK